MVIHGIKILFFKILENLFKNYVFAMKSGLARGFKRRYGFGFRPKFLLTEDEEFLIKMDFDGRVVYDVGGYIGIYSMFFSRAVGKDGVVITFEPNPKNYHELFLNLQLNKISNVITRNVGLGQGREKRSLFFDPTLPGRGTLRANAKKGDHTKSRREIVEIEIDSLDNIMQKEKMPYPDFIKIDIEGFEIDVLKGMSITLDRHKPDLFIEIHGVLQEEMIHMLHSSGYSIRHIESNRKNIQSDESPIRGGHIYCRIEEHGQAGE